MRIWTGIRPASLAQSLQSLVRVIRFQTLQQVTRWRHTKELPKTAIFHNRKTAVVYMLIHLLPLFGAITLVVLNFLMLSVGLWNGSSTTALQFVAKALELLMQASLAAIALALVRSQALSSRAIPFGGVVAPYRVTDVSYLWSLDFWGTITSSNFIGLDKALFCALVPFLILLGALVGPSSAVLMIPRLGEFPQRNGFSFLGRDELMYPLTMDLENISIAVVDYAGDVRTNSVEDAYTLTPGLRYGTSVSSLLQAC